MYCLRRVAFRVLSSPSTSILTKPRSITTLTPSLLRTNCPTIRNQLQRRYATETQAEPEADGAIEAHGENPIASSSYEQPTSQEAPESTEQNEGRTVAAAISSSTESPQESAATYTERKQETTAAFARRTSDAAAAGVIHRGMQERRDVPANPSVYVGNLFFDVTEGDLKREFQQFGTIESVKLIYDGRGLSKGFGYVEFTDQASAARAIEKMNQQVYEGRRITVQYTIKKDRTASFAHPTKKNSPTKTLFIGNMSFEMSDQDLNDLFREIKNVIDVRVAIDRRTGQPRGFAHADFLDVASATKAIPQLENKEMYGRKLRIDYGQASAKVRTA